MDIFTSKDITPMLISENKPPFDNDDYIYELKLDGIRCLVYLDDKVTELRNKRNKNVTGIYPELEQINAKIKKRCILDGEILVLKNGKPYYEEIKRRSLMSNPFKIKMSAQKLPVCFTAFDIIYFDNKPIFDLPLLERKSVLLDNIEETSRLAVSRYLEGNGVAFFNLTKEQGLEGIVAKRKNSKYYPGRNTKDWIKMKALLDDDFIVCGYYKKDINITSIILGGYDNGKLVYQSHVILGISRSDFKIISSTGQVTKNFYPDFPDFEGAVWIEPNHVCVVQYMERTSVGGLRQPVFKGLRNDKLPTECIM